MTFEKFNKIIDTVKAMTGCSEDTGIMVAQEIMSIIEVVDETDPINKVLTENPGFEGLLMAMDMIH